MALPNFFVIGAPKAGTTSLHNYLNQHPEVQMSSVKEPQFFSGPPDGIPYRMGRISDRTEYELLFDESFPLRGEATAEYAVAPRRQGVPIRIKEAIAEPKFIYMVRDPIARTVSNYKMMVALKGERRSLSAAIGDLSDRHSLYISPSLYATQAELYLKHFPQEDFLIMDQRELREDREVSLRRIFEFLGVEPTTDSIRTEEELLTSDDWRMYPDGYGDFVARRIAPWFHWIPQAPRRRVRSAIERCLWREIDTELDADTRARLVECFSPEADRLRALTGRAFSSWEV